MDILNSVIPKSKSARMVTAAAVAAAGVAGFYFYQKNRYRLVGHLSRIIVYPVKACQGIDVDEARCEKLGLESGGAEDRRYMVITGANNTFVTQRQHPELVLVSTMIDDDDLILDAPDMPQLRVQHYYKWEGGWTSRNITVKKWGNSIEALDCGDEAADWFTKFLNKRRSENSDAVRDEGKPEEKFRLAVYPREFGGITAQIVTEGLDGQVKIGEDDDKAAFSDLAPYLLLNTASLDSINYDLVSHGKQPVAADNFRPNIVVDPVPGHEKPFDEDTWDQIVIGEEASFRFYKPCTRCRVTTVDTSAGEFRPDNEPLETLRRIRSPQSAEGKKLFKSNPLFCLNLAPDKLGWIRVGDPVYAKTGDKFAGI